MIALMLLTVLIILLSAILLGIFLVQSKTIKEGDIVHKILISIIILSLVSFPAIAIYGLWS